MIECVHVVSLHGISIILNVCLLSFPCLTQTTMWIPIFTGPTVSAVQKAQSFDCLSWISDHVSEHVFNSPGGGCFLIMIVIYAHDGADDGGDDDVDDDDKPIPFPTTRVIWHY